jgi:hypothetical protein
MGSATTSKKKMDMDQFMDDFLDGKYLDDAAPASKKMDTTPSMPRRKSHGEAHDRAPPTRGVRRTKTNDDAPVRPGGDRRTVRRTKSGEGYRGIAGKRTSKSKEQMDPQMVLLMMEMYATLDNAEKADEYLHYNSEKRTSGTSSANTTSIPPAILTQQTSPNAA